MAYGGQEVKLFSSKKEQEKYENFAGAHSISLVSSVSFVLPDAWDKSLLLLQSYDNLQKKE